MCHRLCCGSQASKQSAAAAGTPPRSSMSRLVLPEVPAQLHRSFVKQTQTLGLTAILRFGEDKRGHPLVPCQLIPQ